MIILFLGNIKPIQILVYQVNVFLAMKLKNIPTGTSIHNIELKSGAGGKLCRSAGSFAQVLGVQDKYIMRAKQWNRICSTLGSLPLLSNCLPRPPYGKVSAGVVGLRFVS